ncbi:MAG: hypothetical protein K6T65_14255 [Peptococcaceae bacterium]|nr:hypothetical protein [Peptococcaceae bacterium]
MFKNKVLLAVISLIFLFSFSLLDSNKVLAANFTQWCYGTEEIVEIAVDSNNNVWAVGRNGHIGRFNGLEWERMADTSPASNIYDGLCMDLDNGRIWVTYYKDWNCTGVSYWTQSTGWVYAGLLESSYGLTGGTILVDKNGGVWGTEKEAGGLYRWNGGTGWNKVWETGVPSGQTLDMVNGWFYDKDANRIYFVFELDDAWRFGASYYDINTNTGYVYPKANYQYHGLVYGSYKKNGTVYLGLGESVYWNGSDWSRVDSGTGLNNLKKYVFGGNVWGCRGYYDKSDYNYITSNNVTYTWPFSNNIKSLAEGKHGEIYAAGEGGRMAVLMGGSWYQDTGFFSDYVLGDVKNLTVEARDAANTAKISAEQAKNNTWNATYNKSAATLAGEAASGSWYNGQSAAYWASVAALNSTPMINRVQGLNGATCTTGSSFTVVITSTPSTNVQYRVTCGSFDSGWTTNNTITITDGIANGANTITAYVKNAVGNTATATLVFFKA